jgi:hypothetical protein
VAALEHNGFALLGTGTAHLAALRGRHQQAGAALPAGDAPVALKGVAAACAFLQEDGD